MGPFEAKEGGRGVQPATNVTKNVLDAVSCDTRDLINICTVFCDPSKAKLLELISINPVVGLETEKGSGEMGSGSEFTNNSNSIAHSAYVFASYAGTDKGPEATT